ncbi:DUF4898 domain-containing protein [Sulfolobus sp. E5-1-F]|uniref:DUF4898 domain-containing protein n=1 Tax=Sulfolobaceae TaxID=118883 RepID=UPI001296C0B4|nr:MULTISPECIES: DUF4898 domain-containing protein [unclassified Sulfolobus]QGA54129.1 DUF4898 domain-containing protein [Sulfolobus sp. E5-1-F]QGA69186.1 DUF4898 domain-containing protein [Sulfolobus sp. E11-6]
MSTVPINELSQHIEDGLIQMISRSGNMKFIKHFSPDLIVDAQKFFKTFVPTAKYYVVIVPHNMKNEEVKDELISMSRSNFNLTILYSYKLKDKMFIIGYD